MKPIRIVTKWAAGFSALALVLIVALGRVNAQKIPPAPAPDPVAGIISGRVTLQGGKSAVGFRVIARSAGFYRGGPADEAITDAAGRYTLTIKPDPPRNSVFSGSIFFSGPRRQGLPAYGPHTFSVTVANGGQPYLEPLPWIVSLDRPDHAEGFVNFVLRLGPQITVQVHDAQTGRPVPGVRVRPRLDLYGQEAGALAGETDADGRLRFRIGQFEARLSLEPPAGIEAAPGSVFYREVHLSAPEEVVWDVKTYRADPAATASVWRGVVLKADGRPAAGVRVRVFRSSLPTSEVAGITDAAGRWAFPMPRLSPEELQYNNVAVLAEAQGEDGALLVPTPEQTWAGMTLRLGRMPWASYTGVAVGADGRPEAGVPVSCRGWLSVAFAGFGQSAVGGGVSDAAGRFTLAHLPAGQYQIHLGGRHYGTVAVPPDDPSKVIGIKVAAGERHDLGAVTVPPADAIVGGFVLDSTSKPASDVSIVIQGEHVKKQPTVLPDGSFRAYHVVNEPLTLSVGGPGRTGEIRVPIVAGEENARIVLPAGFMPAPAPPAAPPIAAPAAAPPVLSAGPIRIIPANLYGTLWFGGPSVRFSPVSGVPRTDLRGMSAALSLASYFSSPDSGFWHGRLADMDGMTFRTEGTRGILTDRAGRTLWSGIVAHPPAYTILTDSVKGRTPRSTLLDQQGHTLWAGQLDRKGFGVLTEDGQIEVIGVSRRIVWEGDYSGGEIAYLSVENGYATSWNGNPFPIVDGVTRFSSSLRRADFRDAAGRVLWSGRLPTLSAQWERDPGPKTQDYDWHPPETFFPYTVANAQGGVTYRLFDANGTVEQSGQAGRP